MQLTRRLQFLVVAFEITIEMNGFLQNRQKGVSENTLRLDFYYTTDVLMQLQCVNSS